MNLVNLCNNTIIRMKIIISPAKKLNTDIDCENAKMHTLFLKETEELIRALQKMSVSEIKGLMGLSDNLAQLNWQRFQDWSIKNVNTYKAIELFNGAVYESMNIKEFDVADYKFAKENLRILSGLYGILKPQDLILPYRLEMGTKLHYNDSGNLYHFWSDKLHNYIVKELNGEKLINLASVEYSKVLKLAKLKTNIITPVFKDYKNGKLKVISFFAKKARGEMCNYIIKNKITNMDDLCLFENLGYQFQEFENDEILFIR